MNPIKDRLKNAWNAFMNKDPTSEIVYKIDEGGYSSYYKPDLIRLTFGIDKNIITSIFNTIAVDCASIDVRHVRLDSTRRFQSYIDNSSLDNCLTTEANLDQTGRNLIEDIVLSMLDDGVVAVVPIDWEDDPTDGSLSDIYTLRVGKIIEWKPSFVKVRCYNERNGKKEEIWVPKLNTAIIENPFYAIMNDTNSTAKRLSRKLALLDSIDEKQGSNLNKLNMIIQLPYGTRSEMKRNQAEDRVKNLEDQLQNSPHGIAYSDQTEKIIQLNRPLDNNLIDEVKMLTEQLYQQLAITPGVIYGTADEKVMNNYFSRTVEPIMNNVVEEMRRKFLTKTARTQGQSIMYFRDPFKLAPISDIAEMTDKMTRNEVMTANEVRQAIGMPPSQDPRADELKNANISEAKDQEHINVEGQNITNDIVGNQGEPVEVEEENFDGQYY